MNDIIDFQAYKIKKQEENDESFNVDDDQSVRNLAFSVMADVVCFLNDELGFDPNEDIKSVNDMIHCMEFIASYIKRVNRKSFYLHESIDNASKSFKMAKKDRLNIINTMLEGEE